MRKMVKEIHTKLEKVFKRQDSFLMPHQVNAAGLQSAAAEVPHMPTNPVAAPGTFLKNRHKQSHAAEVKPITVCF